MSYLKPGTLCVIVGGCPKNIGFIVEVLDHLEPSSPRAELLKWAKSNQESDCYGTH